MLSDIRKYLMAQGGMVSLYDLANHFDTEEPVMAGMLSHWLRKGRLKMTESPCAKSCGGCDRGADGEWYQWVGVVPPALISLCPKD